LLPFTLNRTIPYEGNKLPHLPLENTEEMEKLQEGLMSREKHGEGLSCIPKRLFNAFYKDVLESNLPMFNVISLVRQEEGTDSGIKEIRDVRVGNLNAKVKPPASKLATKMKRGYVFGLILKKTYVLASWRCTHC
jgi:hypothetical protein